MFFSQTALIFAGRATQGAPVANFSVPRRCELVRLQVGEDAPLAALYGPAICDDGQAGYRCNGRPTILYFYGNGNCMATALDVHEELRRIGANVLIVDLPGYGLSGGRVSEVGCYAAADAALDYLYRRSDVDPTQIIAAGWSLGGAIAIDLASRKKVAGLIALSTFTSIADQAHHWFPILPAWLARPFLVAQFRSIDKIGRVHCPVFLGHGRRDVTVPFSASARLAAAAGGPVTRVEFESGHNDTFDSGACVLMPALRGWLDEIAPDKYPPRRPSTPQIPALA